MSLIDVHEIFSQSHIYLLTGSHFTQILKIAVLSISLYLEAQYFGSIMDPIMGYIHSQETIYLVYIGLKL